MVSFKKFLPIQESGFSAPNYINPPSFSLSSSVLVPNKSKLPIGINSISYKHPHKTILQARFYLIKASLYDTYPQNQRNQYRDVDDHALLPVRTSYQSPRPKQVGYRLLQLLPSSRSLSELLVSHTATMAKVSEVVGMALRVVVRRFQPRLNDLEIFDVGKMNHMGS